MNEALNELAGRILDLTSHCKGRAPSRWGMDTEIDTDEELRKQVVEMIEEFANEYWIDR